MAAAPYPFNIKMVLVPGQSSNDGNPTAALSDEVSFETPVFYTWRDPVEGERIRELVVTPPVTVNFMEKVFYFPVGGTETGGRVIGLILRSGPAAVSGTLALNLPSSWRVEPAVLSFTIGEPFTEKRVSFTVTPPRGDAVCDVAARAEVGGKTYHLSRVTIEYPHIPAVTLHPGAEARLVRVDVKHKGGRIAYIMGSGDEIPPYLVQVGYGVDVLSEEDLHTRDFGAYDAVITGVRAYNTRDVLKDVQGRLLDYVKKGGRLIVQYNVNRGLTVGQLGPYPFQISRSRVAEEDAAVTFLDPHHPLLCFPNKIEPGDFAGWVQERGLYFADQWDANYTPLLSCHDGGEEPQKGGLLFARYGKGYFIYTGYSFFRQLPEGVPGALKLFVNMISSPVGN